MSECAWWRLVYNWCCWKGFQVRKDERVEKEDPMIGSLRNSQRATQELRVFEKGPWPVMHKDEPCGIFFQKCSVNGPWPVDVAS